MPGRRGRHTLPTQPRQRQESDSSFTDADGHTVSVTRWASETLGPATSGTCATRLLLPVDGTRGEHGDGGSDGSRRPNVPSCSIGERSHLPGTGHRRRAVHDADGQVRDGAWVCEITGMLDLTVTVRPKGVPVILRTADAPETRTASAPPAPPDCTISPCTTPARRRPEPGPAGGAARNPSPPGQRRDGRNGGRGGSGVDLGLGRPMDVDVTVRGDVTALSSTRSDPSPHAAIGWNKSVCTRLYPSAPVGPSRLSRAERCGTAAGMCSIGGNPKPTVPRGSRLP